MVVCGFVMVCSGSFAWPRWSAWDDVSNVNAQCACATELANAVVSWQFAFGEWTGHWSGRYWDDGWRSGSPCAFVRCRDVWASSDIVTPFWTVADNPTHFVVSDRLLLLVWTGCPSWRVGRFCPSWCCCWLLFLILDVCLLILVNVSHWVPMLNDSLAETMALLYGFLTVLLPFHWPVGKFGRLGC